MKFNDAMQLLVCLNDAGVNKACELLEGVLQDKEFILVTKEQLIEQIIEKNNQDKIEMQRKLDEEAARRKKVSDTYSLEFKMIGDIPISQLEILNAIRDTENNYLMGLAKAYNWGYIQGKRAERQRKTE